ncbi:hypothetical protein ES703_43546 [subsurface metagenome]
MTEEIHFTTLVLGPAAGYRLEKRQVTQTLRSESDIVTNAILNGRVSAGDQLEVALDGTLVGRVEIISMELVTWDELEIDDARRGGFDNLADLEQALKRAGYRFKPLNQYELYRIQFTWLEKVYA